MRHKNRRTCRYSLLRWSRTLWQLGILRCSEGDSVSARRVSFSHSLYLSQPAPPSSLTSTDPPRLWEGISRLQKYSLSGKLPHCAWCLCVCFLPHLLTTTVSTWFQSLPCSNGSVIADYELTFVMPEEEQDLLTSFTLSRNMVYNVFRQFLHEQGLLESDPMYIDASSLNMFSSR